MYFTSIKNYLKEEGLAFPLVSQVSWWPGLPGFPLNGSARGVGVGDWGGNRPQPTRGLWADLTADVHAPPWGQEPSPEAALAAEDVSSL